MLDIVSLVSLLKVYWLTTIYSKTFEEKTFVDREQSYYLWENLYGSMLVYLTSTNSWQSIYGKGNNHETMKVSTSKVLLHVVYIHKR